MKRFHKGDLVRLIKPVPGWESFSEGVIVDDFQPQADGAGGEEGETGSYWVQWDDYDYGNPSNHHFVRHSAIEGILPTEEEINLLFQRL